MANPGAEVALLPNNLNRMTDWAVLVIDMWNKHWCTLTTNRVAELAPRVNAFLTVARQRGALIIHAPSNTMGHYDPLASPARQRTLNAPQAALPSYSPASVVLPIDDSDEGCEDVPPSFPANVWTQEIASISIDEAVDVIVDDSIQEVYNVLQAATPPRRRILVTGVAVNMCVLHTRAFSINKLVALKDVGALAQVILVRDLTDSMYNPHSAPYVNHFAGTDLVVKYIEQNFCPTTDSSLLLGPPPIPLPPFRFAADQRPWPGWGQYQVQYGTPSGSSRWLRGDRGGVQLVQDQASASLWYRQELGPGVSTFVNLDVPTTSFLSGDPTTGTVQMLAESKDITAGMRWWALEAVPTAGDAYRLKCCGRFGDFRYLEGSSDGRLELQNRNSPVTGSGWRLFRL